MMQLANAGFYRQLSVEEYPVLTDALGDTPETVDSLHLLRHGRCKAYVAGDPSQVDGAIVQADDWPTEPTGFGSDPQVLWELLKAVKGWDCILVNSECAPILGEAVTREMGVRVRYLGEVCHVLTKPVSIFREEAVRQLTLIDLELLESVPSESRASLWGSVQALLSGGVVACAIVSGQIVATALTAACSERYVDIGVYTRQDYRGRGLATATASIVTQRVQEAGQIPVWGAGEHNIASLRVARKLGFTEVSRRMYVILDKSEGARGA
jgi:GNAT superfamily N-acetyltransferase